MREPPTNTINQTKTWLCPKQTLSKESSISKSLFHLSQMTHQLKTLSYWYRFTSHAWSQIFTSKSRSRLQINSSKQVVMTSFFSTRTESSRKSVSSRLRESQRAAKCTLYSQSQDLTQPLQLLLPLLKRVKFRTSIQSLTSLLQLQSSPPTPKKDTRLLLPTSR